jgi:hypothetical protein
MAEEFGIGISREDRDPHGGDVYVAWERPPA